MNRIKDSDPAYISLVVYGVVGAIVRYFMIPQCNSGFADIHLYVSCFAILFILIGIGWGLYSFIFQNGWKPRIGQGIVTGFGLGFGGMTVYLLLNPCI